MKSPQELLQMVADKSPCFTELRYHSRETQTVQVQNGLVKQIKSSVLSGVGIRVLIDGAWGFASTSLLTLPALEAALKQAIECGKSISQMKRAKVGKLPEVKLARGVFQLPGYEELRAMPLEKKLHAVREAESKARKASIQIQSANSSYQEIFEDKVTVTSDGASAASKLARSELRVNTVAEDHGQMSSAHQAVGRTGNWECLFNERSIDELSDITAKLSVDLLKAPHIPGGKHTVILSPSIVGLLAHEAIGHTVEADFVLSGSVAKDKIGQSIASPLITLCDSGLVPTAPHGGGDLEVDDEGVPTQVTKVIDQGILVSYLHNRESAALFGVAPTGNARAWLYHDEPLIRMRNTYIEPGNQSIEEIIASTENGYLIDVPLGGQADATGEFMFGAQKVTKIENGKLTTLYRGATISGQAFEVLSTADAVSKEFQLDLGSGYCGKGQPAKVDAGGPYIRVKTTIGGVQS